MAPHRILPFACLAAMLLFTACSTPRPVDRLPQYNAAPTVMAHEEPFTTMSPFQDVPLPDGLEEVPGQSVIMENYNVRIGLATYWSRLPLSSLEIFFRGELKNNGWQLVTAFNSQTCTSLLFQKREFWCQILLEDRGAVDVRIGVSRDNRS